MCSLSDVIRYNIFHAIDKKENEISVDEVMKNLTSEKKHTVYISLGRISPYDYIVSRVKHKYIGVNEDMTLYLTSMGKDKHEDLKESIKKSCNSKYWEERSSEYA